MKVSRLDRPAKQLVVLGGRHREAWPVPAQCPLAQADATRLAHRRRLLASTDGLLEDLRPRAAQQPMVPALTAQVLALAVAERYPSRLEVSQMTQLRLGVVPFETSAPALRPKPVTQARPVATVVTEDQQEEPVVPGREADPTGREPRIQPMSG